MKEIKGRRLLTVHAEAGETYKITYSTPPVVNILNTTEGNVKVSSDGKFTDDGTSGAYITIPAAAAANETAMPFVMVYIEADESGDIVIERCR